MRTDRRPGGRTQELGGNRVVRRELQPTNSLGELRITNENLHSLKKGFVPLSCLYANPAHTSHADDRCCGPAYLYDRLCPATPSGFAGPQHRHCAPLLCCPSQKWKNRISISLTRKPAMRSIIIAA